MVKEIWPDDFCCPKCGKTDIINWGVSARIYSMRRLDVPYFICGDCRLCGYNKNLIGQTIRRWGEYGSRGWGFTYKKIYNDSIKWLEEILGYYTKRASYKLIARFKQNKKPD